MKTGLAVIGVTGSRWWWDTRRLGRELDTLAGDRAAVFLHHGMCPPRDRETGKAVRWDKALKREADGETFWGADWLADRHAEARGWFVIRYPADWNRYGKAAGMIRNTTMVRAANAHVWAGFLLPGSTGTVHCLEQAVAHGVLTRSVHGRPWSAG